MTQEHLTSAPPAIAQAAPEDEVFVFPLSFAQQRLWFLDQLIPNSPIYNIPGAVQFKGQLNLVALEQSLQAIIQRHEILRTTFEIVDGQPSQVISAHAQPGAPLLRVVDLSALSAEQQQAEAQRLATAEAQHPFNLQRDRLLRVTVLHFSNTDHGLLLNMHHIISDGWSVGVFMQELITLYDAFAQGQPSPLPDLPIQYADFTFWQHEQLQGESLAPKLTYWKHQLAGEIPPLQLPSDRPRPPAQTFRGARQAIALSPEMTHALKSLSQQHNATLFMTLLAAFQTLLYRYTGQEDIWVGSPIANRQQCEVECLIGFFVNTLVLRSRFSGTGSFLDLLHHVREVTLGAYAHQDVPFEQLVEALQPERSLSQNPLFQVMFVLQNAQTPPLDARWSLSPLQMDTGTAKFDLTLSFDERPDRLVGEIEYSTDLFDAATIARMIGHLHTLLTAIVADPTQPLCRLPLLTPQEQQQLRNWNNTQVDYPSALYLHQLVEQQVERSPAAIAVQFEGQTLTYHALNQRANQLAHHLQSLGVGPEVLVGICVDRSLDMVIGLLAILKAGGAYVPLDPGYPPERLTFMLQDAQVPVLLTQSHLAAKLASTTAQRVDLDQIGELLATCPAANPTTQVQADNLAYVIYTSGSTGQPKGAMNTHRAICNRLLWMQDAYGLAASDRVLQKTPFSFDVSVWEFFWPLITGACLVVARPDGHKDAAYLIQLITAQQVTTLHFVPSMLQIFLDEPGVETCHSIQRIICSGEALPVSLQNRCLSRLKAQLYNLYGPTEAAIDVTHWHCQPNTHRYTVPIGYPISNIQIHLLDAHLNPVPIGVPGELYIGGVGVARGYLNRPELTAERFIKNPFAMPVGGQQETDQQKAERCNTVFCPLASDFLYKTGDLARYLPDGAIEYLGRLDHQVKLRGFRIELGEIEATVSQHPDVREAAVIVREDNTGDKRLVAYVVSDLVPDRVPFHGTCQVEVAEQPPIEVATEDLAPGGVGVVGIPLSWRAGQSLQLTVQLPGRTSTQVFTGAIAWINSDQAGIRFDCSATEQTLLQQSVEYLLETQGFLKVLQRTITASLRKFLQQKLPAHMIPDRFVLLSSLPLTANGKCDRRALPVPNQLRPELEKGFLASQTPLQEQLANLWKQVLKLEQVGIQDNFFDLGGNSLLAAQLMVNIREVFRLDLPMRHLFEQPTIAGFAHLLTALQRGEQTTPVPILNLKADAVLPVDIQPINQTFTLHPPRHILLTGATGFLGAFLLDELLRQTQADIYCLIRASNNQEGRDRLKASLEKYALWNPALSARVIPVIGNLAQPRLGLTESQFDTLAHHIDTIYHSGAEVNFVKPYSHLKTTNVLGTQEVIRLACQGKTKPLHYISTIGVFGAVGYFTGLKQLRETQDLALSEPYLYIGYSQSKWVAENLLWIAKERGLPITVFRAGLIGGHTQTGFTNTNDYPSRLLKGCIQMGSFPDMGEDEDKSFIPVDFAAQAIAHLSHQQSSLGQAFHLINPHPIHTFEYFNLVRDYGYPLRQLSYTVWKEELMRHTKQDQSNALYPLLPMMTEKVHENRLTLPELFQDPPDLDCQNVLDGLAGTAIACPPINAQLLDVYLSYFIRSGFLAPPSAQ